MTGGEGRRRYVVSLTAEEAAVVDAIAALNGYPSRPGVWIGDKLRALVARRRGDPDIVRLLEARRDYQAAHGRRTKHGFGVIDGGAR